MQKEEPASWGVREQFLMKLNNHFLLPSLLVGLHITAYKSTITYKREVCNDENLHH